MRVFNFVGVLAAAFAVLPSVHATAATIPIAEDFDDNSTGFAFSSSNVGVTGAVAGGVLTVDSALNMGSQSLNALANVDNANGLAITMDTDIRATAWTSGGVGGSSTGLLAFSTNPAAGAQPGGANSGYLADIVFPSTANNGFIRIFNNATGANIVQSPNFALGSLALNETYHLSFTATPGLGGVLDLSLTITDTTGTFIDDDGVVIITGTTPAVASTGTFFGYRQRVGGGGSSANRTLDVVYDNFSITAVPEPNSFALLGMASATLGLVRRRNRA